MPKGILRVFMIIGALVLGFLGWQIAFNDGGVVKTGWNAIVTPVNGVYEKITGNPNLPLLPSWGQTGINQQNPNLQSSQGGY